MSKKLLEMSNVKNVKILAVSAVFAAISIVCGKFLAFNVGDLLRFSFENLPIILIGIFFGPVMGALTGLISDIIGCILRGYSINPILTFAAAVIGFLSGYIYSLLNKININGRAVITVLVCHIIGSVLIKSIGLSIWFGSPFYITLLQRALNYLIVSAAESAVIILILNNKILSKQLNDLKRR